MTHLEQIALNQLETIARGAAVACDEQHGYMAGATNPDWKPHKWVIDAMLAAVSIRNSAEIEKLAKELRMERQHSANLSAALRKKAWPSTNN